MAYQPQRPRPGTLDQAAALEAIRESRKAISSLGPRQRLERPAPTRGGTAPPPPPNVPTPAPDARSDHPLTPTAGTEDTARTEPDGRSSEVERLAAAVEALTAKYEMEVAAHRSTTELLIAQQQAHIDTLKAALRRQG